MLNRIVGFLLGLEEDVRRFFIHALIFSTFFPALMIVSAFGHRTIGWFPLWTACLLLPVIAVTFYAARMGFGVGPALLGIGGLFVALIGVSPQLRLVGSLVGITYTEAAVLVLAIFAWGGVILGYTFAPGEELEIQDALKPAREWFKEFCIFAFWLGLAGFLIGTSADRVPGSLAVIIIALAIIVVPGMLALPPGRTGFYIMFGLTMATLLGALVLAGLIAIGAIKDANPVVWWPKIQPYVTSWRFILGSTFLGCTALFVGGTVFGVVVEKKSIGKASRILAFSIFLPVAVVWLTIGGGSERVWDILKAQMVWWKVYWMIVGVITIGFLFGPDVKVTGTKAVKAAFALSIGILFYWYKTEPQSGVILTQAGKNIKDIFLQVLH